LSKAYSVFNARKVKPVIKDNPFNFSSFISGVFLWKTVGAKKLRGEEDFCFFFKDYKTSFLW
jgi:hypothetical protein